MQVYSLSKKKLIEVPDDPTMQDGSATTQTPQVSQVQPASPTLAGGEAATQVDALTLPKTRTGYTMEQHQAALSAAQANGDKTAEADIKYDLENEYAYQKDTGGIDKADKADKATRLKGGILSIAKQLQNAIANKDKYGEKEYKSLLNSLSSSLVLKKKEAENLGAALTPTELAILSGQVPVTQSIGGSFPQRAGAFFTGREPVQRGEVVETDDELNRKMTVLIAGMEGKEVTPEMLQSGQSEEKGIASRLFSGAGGDVIDMVSGLASIPGQYIDGARQGKTPTQVSGELATKMGKGLVNEYGSLVGVQTENGQPILDPTKSVFEEGGFNAPTGIELDDAIDHAIDNPIDTALDLIPPAKLLQLTRVGKVAKLAKLAKAGEVAETVKTTANPVQKLMTKVSDVVNGGGSKEYLKNNAGKVDAIPQNQILMDEGILLHPTETGRITATANAMKKHGSQLETAYKSSDRVFKGTELGDIIKQKLTEQGYDDASIKYITNHMNTQGSFDLASADNLITMDRAWNTARKLENSPPKMLKSPESTKYLKQLSTDSARIIREQLASKVPETVELNKRYSGLRDYYENRLDDPQGLDIRSGSGRGITGSIVNAAKNVVNPLVNAGYNGTKLIRDKRMKPENPNAFRTQTSAPSATLKPVDSAAKQGDNVGMSIDEAIQPKAAVKNLKKKR